MKMIKIVLLVLLLLALGFTFFLNYIGFFSKIIVEEKEVGPFVLVYEDHKGDYKGVAQVENDIYYSLLNNYQIETFKGFGIYYDDPKKVAKEDLRSIAGCILEEKDYDKIEKLKEDGLKIKEIPKQNSIVAEFPFKNQFSIIAGVIRVYPELSKYITENNLVNNEMMEIYDTPTQKIIYLMKK
ncbi:MAG: GyrI-like domain-containing protein [Candidatus Falkowbacteria bacterium]